MIEQIDFSEWLKKWEWKQGEHVLVIGPTGSGKTTLLLQLLPRRRYVVFLATKPRDDVAETLIRDQGYRRTKSWPPGRMGERWVLQPPIDSTDQVPAQAAALQTALRKLYLAGGWAVILDELQYLVDIARADGLLKLLWHQGRSLKLTIVAGSQRPAWVPVIAYSSATHLFLFRTPDQRDMERYRDIAGQVDPKTIIEAVKQLRPHETLYVNTRTGDLAKFMAPKVL